jgi:[ribosomal protein S5]-alanine N-acetyltransferase
MKGVFLITERLIVRDLPARAAPAIARFHSENWHFHRQWEPYRSSDYFSAGMQRRVIRHERRADSMLHLWLFLREGRGIGWRSKSLIGSLSLTSIERGSLQSCLLGYKMDARHRRRGYMREAVTAVIDHAFVAMGLHRIEATVMPSNHASLALLESLGFRNEGCARALIQIQGTWEDHFRLALLSDEWHGAPHKRIRQA